MDFLLWLERLYDTVAISRGQTCLVYIDPTIYDLKRLGVNIRGLVDGDHIFVWREEDCQHYKMAQALGLPGAEETGFYLSLTGDKYRLFVSQHSSLQKLFLHPKIIKLYPHLIPYDKQSDWGDQVPHFDKLYQPQILQPQIPQMPQTAVG